LSKERLRDSEAWREENERRLARLAEHLRAELWGAIGLELPLGHSEVMRWILARVNEQRLAGDRHRLYLPAAVAAGEWRQQRATASDADRVRALRDARVLPLRQDGRRLFVETFTGRYPKGEALAWPGLYERRKVQPLALLALAALEVRRQTGCAPEEGLLFLLCDDACGRPSWMTCSTARGLSLWVYDPFIPAEALSDEYVALRRTFIPRGRPKRPTQKTAELIELVRAMRPRGGKHRDNAPWGRVLERWNADHERPLDQYLDVASICRAYYQACRVRRELGMLPTETQEEEQAP